MNMDIDFQDRIDDYVLGRMSDEDRLQFEKEVSLDHEKEEQLQLTLNIKKALKSRQEKLAMIQDFEKDNQQLQQVYAVAHEANYRRVMPDQVASSGKRQHRRLRISGIIGIAAILIVGFFITYTLIPSVENEITPVNMNVESMRGDNSFAQIAGMINNRQYEEALRLIHQSELDNKQERDSITSNTSQSEELEYMLSTLNQRKYDLIWMKANALIGLKRMDEATKILQKLIRQDNPHKAQADSLYQIISK